MQKGYYKKLSYEDKFDRKYACWACNHGGWTKYKTANRRMTRRKLKAGTKKLKTNITPYTTKKDLPRTQRRTRRIKGSVRR